MFGHQLERRIHDSLGSMDLGTQTMLSKSGHPSITQLMLQDALVKSAPDALAASFLQVEDEFLSKDVVCVRTLVWHVIYETVIRSNAAWYTCLPFVLATAHL